MVTSTYDKIGRDKIVQNICALVNELKHNERFCLSIDGAWGSGKTFVLNLLEQKLCENKEYVIIKYDAWANSFYSEPLIAILSCIIDGIQEKMKVLKGYKTAIKGIAGEHAATLIEELSKKTGKLGTFASIVKAILNAIPKFQNEHSFNDNEKIADFKSYLDLLLEVKDNLNLLTASNICKGKQTKLIILVDEIDRCLPDEQLKILERLHHLFDVQNCAVICAINKGAIAMNFQTKYGDGGEEYLRKFFDFSFKLQPESAVYLKNLFDGLSESFAKVSSSNSNIAEVIDVSYHWMVFSPKKVLDSIDNRELSRYFNNLTKLCNAYGWEKFSEMELLFAINGLFLVEFLVPTFLCAQDIELIQQQHIKWLESVKRNSPYITQMPYHDYVLEHFGIDRENPPKEIIDLYRALPRNHPEYSWRFNEAVTYSAGKTGVNNATRAFYGDPIIDVEHLQELRRLINLYGGGER